MNTSSRTGTYVENSALDAFLRSPSSFGAGPFVVSEYSLGEKTRLSPIEYRGFIEAISRQAQFLRVPPVTQIITGNFAEAWRAPTHLERLDVEAALAGREYAQAKLNEICEALADASRKWHEALRGHWADWVETVEGENPDNLIDPRPLPTRRNLVRLFTLDSLGRDEPPSDSDLVPARLQWTIRAWQIAMVFTRMEKEKDSPKDLRNDPIDAVHYALAATFCERIATADKGIRRIRELMPDPRCPLLWVVATGDDLRVESVE